MILAEDNEIRDKLAEHDLHVQTISEVAPIEVSHVLNISFHKFRIENDLHTKTYHTKLQSVTGSTGTCTQSPIYLLGSE